MSAIIDDDLVRSVAVAITGAPYPTARSLAKARAALAVAVPAIGERCAASVGSAIHMATAGKGQDDFQRGVMRGGDLAKAAIRSLVTP